MGFGVFFGMFRDGVMFYDVFKKAQFSVVKIMNGDFWRDDFYHMLVKLFFK